MHIGIAVGLFIVSYLAQLLLCFKVKNTQIKLIPFYIGLAIAFLGLLVYAEVWRVSFSTQETLGGCQEVYLNSKGQTLLVVYGE